MTDKKSYPYTVDATEHNYWTEGRFETYEEAEAKARTKAWNNAQDYSVFKLIATAAAPEEINSVKVTKAD